MAALAAYALLLCFCDELCRCMSGVASSIDADLENIQRLARFTGLLPKGLFVDNIVKEMKVGRSVERRRTLVAHRIPCGRPALASVCGGLVSRTTRRRLCVCLFAVAHAGGAARRVRLPEGSGRPAPVGMVPINSRCAANSAKPIALAWLGLAWLGCAFLSAPTERCKMRPLVKRIRACRRH